MLKLSIISSKFTKLFGGWVKGALLGISSLSFATVTTFNNLLFFFVLLTLVISKLLYGFTKM